MTSTANTTFYLRWYVHNHEAGWYGSNHSDFDDEKPLASWGLVSRETAFYLCTNQSTRVFARIIDTGRGTVYGAKFNTQATGCNLIFTPEGPLELEAGDLISDDPKLQIKAGGTTTPCTFIWDGAQWSYQIGGGESQRYVCGETLHLDSGSGSVPITVRDTSGAAGRCALYHADATLVPSKTPLPTGTAVGLVDVCEVVPGSGRVSFDAEPGSYTLNLFVDRMSRLALAPAAGA